MAPTLLWGAPTSSLMELNKEFQTHLGRREDPLSCYLTDAVLALRAWEAAVAALSDERQQDQEFLLRFECSDGKVASILYRWNPGYQKGVPGGLKWS